MATINVGNAQFEVAESAEAVVSDVNTAIQQGRKWVLLTRDGQGMGVRAETITGIKDE